MLKLRNTQVHNTYFRSKVEFYFFLARNGPTLGSSFNFSNVDSIIIYERRSDATAHCCGEDSTEVHTYLLHVAWPCKGWFNVTCEFQKSLLLGSENSERFGSKRPVFRHVRQNVGFPKRRDKNEVPKALTE